MKNKRTLLLFLLLMGVVCGSIYSNIKHRQYYEDALPPLIMLDKKLYQLYDINQEKPEDSADGYITKIVSNQIIPSEDKTANFGNIGMQYWQQPNGVCILVNNNYLLFKLDPQFSNLESP